MHGAMIGSFVHLIKQQCQDVCNLHAEIMLHA